MDDMAFYAALVERIITNTDNQPPSSFSEDVCDGIRYALSSLESRELECLKLHLGEGESYAAIAREWNMSTSNVQRIEGQAIRKLRDTSRWNYIRYGIAGYLQEAKNANRKQGFQEGYKAGYKDGLEDGRTGKTPPDADLEVLNLPLECLELSVRAHNCLIAARCERIGDVARLPEETISRMRNLGKKSAKEVACALAGKGIWNTDWDKYVFE